MKISCSNSENFVQGDVSVVDLKIIMNLDPLWLKSVLTYIADFGDLQAAKINGLSY